MGYVAALWSVLVDVTTFWYRTLREWRRRKTPIEMWYNELLNAETFEDWEEAALHLDHLLGLDLWRNNIAAKEYDYRFIQARIESLAEARRSSAVAAIINTVRSGLVRNLGNITAAKLYNQSFSGTKYLIEEYVTHVAEAIHDVSELPTISSFPVEFGGSGVIAARPAAAAAARLPVVSAQLKLDFVHNSRQAFGRTTLVLQGGSIFGMCHLGVIKALHQRGLLPRIITGTATGALMAALVAIHTEDELPDVLRGDGIDLSAFSNARAAQEDLSHEDVSLAGVVVVPASLRILWKTLLRRLSRFRREGYLLDVHVLEACVRANIGDITFQEAYRRSKRILNITVATETADGRTTGVPTLLNYITAPNVLVWSAAMASNASPALYGRHSTPVLCKDAHGNVVPWAPATTVVFRPWIQSDRYAPLTRVAQLFNVNHFIVSQARPYLVPFLQSDMHGPSMLRARSKLRQWGAFLTHMLGLELRHRLRQLDSLQLLPLAIRRFLIDEAVPGATASLTLVPDVSAADFVRLLSTPTKETLDYWILKGERSVWPAMAALQVRCAIEAELERSYHYTRRLRPPTLLDPPS